MIVLDINVGGLVNGRYIGVCYEWWTGSPSKMLNLMMSDQFVDELWRNLDKRSISWLRRDALEQTAMRAGEFIVSGFVASMNRASSALADARK